MRAMIIFEGWWATPPYRDWLGSVMDQCAIYVLNMKVSAPKKISRTVMINLVEIRKAHQFYSSCMSTSCVQSLLSSPGPLGASRSAACCFIGSSLTSLSSPGACASSISRTWSNRRSSILPRCLSRLRMDAMFLCLTRCRGDCRRPMMSRGRSSGLMRPCSLSQLMQSMSGVVASRTSACHVSLLVQNTRLFLQQSVKDAVSSASHCMMKQ